MVSFVNVQLVRNFKSIWLMVSNVVLISMNVQLDSIIVDGCHAVISVLMDHPMVFKGTHGGMKTIHNAFSGKNFALVVFVGMCDEFVTILYLVTHHYVAQMIVSHICLIL